MPPLRYDPSSATGGGEGEGTAWTQGKGRPSREVGEGAREEISFRTGRKRRRRRVREGKRRGGEAEKK